MNNLELRRRPSFGRCESEGLPHARCTASLSTFGSQCCRFALISSSFRATRKRGALALRGAFFKQTNYLSNEGREKFYSRSPGLYNIANRMNFQLFRPLFVHTNTRMPVICFELTCVRCKYFFSLLSVVSCVRRSGITFHDLRLPSTLCLSHFSPQQG